MRCETMRPEKTRLSFGWLAGASGPPRQRVQQQTDPWDLAHVLPSTGPQPIAGNQMQGVGEPSQFSSSGVEQ